MELLSMLLILFMTGMIVSLHQMKITKFLFSIILFWLGLIVMTENITHNSTILLQANTIPAYVVFVFMTLGSLVVMYGTATGQTK